MPLPRKRKRSVGLRGSQPLGIEVPIFTAPPSDLIIGVTNEGNTLISADGISWEYGDPNDPDGIFIGGFQGGFSGDIVWVPELELFVAGVRSSGWGGDSEPTLPHIATSTDGNHWTRRSSGGFAALGLAVAPGPVIVAGGKNSADTSRIARSTDGITWTVQTDPSFSGFGGHAVWDGSRFFMIGDNYISSPDGITWTVEHDFSGSSFGTGLVWAEELGLWVTCGFADGSGHVVATSSDGATWTGRTSPMDDPGFCQQVAWNGSLFVAVGYDPDYNNSIMTSTDGTTWTLRSTPADRAGYAFGPAVIWVPGLSLWVVELNGLFSDGGYHIVTSPDGITWTDRFETTNLVEGFATNY